ncbi:2243_t:CDS:1 [Ambispora leptoticha]|uniref:2243_t:CDS:1 n=1 Tax=Ambispora leptoticha TaxID=144679 RepID=A0A9N9C8W2_9GLOM|nr:2243_t:CDS:1 [Ambispora leptoticha]
MPKLRQSKNHNTPSDTYIDEILKKINVPSPYDKRIVPILKKFEVDDTTTMSKKPPNSFILYRTVFFHMLNSNNVQLPANKISSLASKKWKNESNAIKQEYERIADEIRECSPKYIPSFQKEPKKQYKWRDYKYPDNEKKKKNSSSNKNYEFSAIDSIQSLSAPATGSDTCPSMSTEIDQGFMNFPLKDKDSTAYGFVDAVPLYFPEKIQSQSDIDHLSRSSSFDINTSNYQLSVPSLSINSPASLTSTTEEARDLEMLNIEKFQASLLVKSAENSYQDTMTFPLEDLINDEYLQF